jgi:hypothetical protein
MNTTVKTFSLTKRERPVPDRPALRVFNWVYG